MLDETKRTFEVKWCIENIKSWLKTRHDPIYSPSFLAETLMDTRWKLKVSSNWQLAEKYVSIVLQRDVEDDYLELIDLNYEISFVTCDGSPLLSKISTKKFAPKTVSQKLNVKQDVILDGKNGDYLSKGVLSVYCKLWKKSMAPKEGQCSLRSIIGKQIMYLDSTIDNFILSSRVPINFTPPSKDISVISLDVYVSHDKFVYKTKHVECKTLSWYSYKLFALDDIGRKTKFDESDDFPKSFTSNNARRGFCSRYLLNGGLTLQLELTYYPGIISEGIESKSSKKLPGIVKNLQNLNVHDLKLFPKLSPSCDKHESTEDESNDGDESSDEDSSQANEDESSDEDEDSSQANEDESSDEDKLNDEDDSSQKNKDESSDKDKSEDDESSHKDKSNDDKEECFNIMKKMNLPSTTLKEDLIALYKDNLFCDIKLHTDTKIFPAHRNILCARSPVFKKMFTTDMKEKASESVSDPDLSSDTMHRMLQFIYTDCIGEFEMQSARDLYFASDKYDITSLKKYCSSFMKNNLCISNVCEVLVVSDAHQDKDLESAAQEFVLRNDKEVFGSDEWKSFMKTFSHLAVPVMYLKCMKE